MYSLFLTRLILYFYGPEIFTKTPIQFYLIYTIFQLIIYILFEKFQSITNVNLENSTNNYSLKFYYKMICFTFLFLSYLSIIMLCNDKIWQVNIPYTILYNIIIFFHIKELNIQLRPHFYNVFFLSSIIKFLSLITISTFLYCITQINNKTSIVNIIIYLLFITIFSYNTCIINTKIKNFRENTNHFIYNGYKSVLIVDFLYFMLSTSLIITIFIHNDYKYVYSKQQNIYEYVSFFCVLLNGGYSIFGLLFTFVDYKTIYWKIIKLNKIQLQKIKNDFVVIVSPSSNDDESNINIMIGKEYPKNEQPQSNEIVAAHLSEVLVS